MPQLKDDAPVGKWMPWVLPWDDAPLDISHLFNDEKPAGKHGFMRVENGDFVFEDGCHPRFWGVLMNSAACFPPHEVARQRAKRLAKFGINIVRLHQFDAEWATPNIFQFAKGKALESTLNFDLESMDRFDYFIHRLREEGMYIYMDLLIYRTFKPADGVDNPNGLTPNGAKPYSLFDRKLIELQKRYNHDLMTHINPYTKKAYKDDPAVCMTLITNENDMFFVPFPELVEPYRSRLEAMYRAWAKDNHCSETMAPSPDPTTLRFFHQVEMNYCREMYDHLREIGVRVPIAGDSWSKGLCLLDALQEMDYTSSNTYWDLWSTQGHNKPLLGERKQELALTPAAMRTSHQPLFVTEWDMTYPHTWRSCSAPMMAAMASFQGWAGATMHTYCYRNSPTDRLGGSIIGGIPYRANFVTYIDPAKFGMFYAAAALYRRGDVRPAEKTVAITPTEQDIYESDYAVRHQSHSKMEALLNCEKHQTKIVLPGREVAAETALRPNELGPVADDKGSILSDTGELYRNVDEKFGWVDTPMSKVVYGFLGGKDALKLNGLRIDVKTPFATIAFTSLTDKPLKESSHILISAVGRCDNTDAKYIPNPNNAENTLRVDMGRAPVLVEIIEAQVELENTCEGLCIWSVDKEGFFAAKLPVLCEGGKLKFTLGSTAHSSIYYLITR